MADIAISKPKLDGDWLCDDPACANVNYARRTSCNRCGKEKIEASSAKSKIGTEIGKAAAEKSRGLFSADDWQCSKCGNVNWARRFQCNLCNAPKFGDVEERTGYGGGYNDRGVVEYNRREDSDDEFDDFGRRRKRFRKTSSDDQEREPSAEKPEKTNKKLDEDEKNSKEIEKEEEEEEGDNKEKNSDKEEEDDEEEEDDDDDDDDEDGDLSKYDLSDWGDEAKSDDHTNSKSREEEEATNNK